MRMSEICVKIAISAITAMAAGTASILASEGTKKGLAILMNPKTTPNADDLIDTVAETAETATMTDSMDSTDITESVAEPMEPETEVEA